MNHPDGVTKELIEKSRWQIEIAGELYDADALPQPFFDPSEEHLMR